MPREHKAYLSDIIGSINKIFLVSALYISRKLIDEML